MSTYNLDDQRDRECFREVVQREVRKKYLRYRLTKDELVAWAEKYFKHMPALRVSNTRNEKIAGQRRACYSYKHTSYVSSWDNAKDIIHQTCIDTIDRYG